MWDYRKVSPEDRLCTGSRIDRPQKFVCSICKKEKHRIEMTRTGDICWECFFKQKEEANDDNFE